MVFLSFLSFTNKGINWLNCERAKNRIKNLERRITNEEMRNNRGEGKRKGESEDNQ